LGSKELEALTACCPQFAEVRDAKDFKPYIMAALQEIAGILGLKVENKNRYDSTDRY